MSGFREENIRVRLQQIVESEDAKNALIELNQLIKVQTEAVQQAALSARTGSIQQVTAIEGVTTALKDQQKAQKASDDEASASRKKAGSEFDELGKQVRNFQGLLAAAFGLSELKSFLLGVVDAKTKIDDFKISLDVMLGSKAKSAELYQAVIQLAKTTPFGLEELQTEITKLKAYGVATDDLIPTITNLGNAAAAVGKDKLPQITLAYGQIMNMGKLMGGETKQLIEAGLPIYQMLADAMGKTKDEVIKMASEHTIMASDVKKAFEVASAAGGRFADMLSLQSKTVGGEISNLSDSFFVAKARIGDFFENQIRSGTRYLSELIDSLAGSDSAIKRTLLGVASIATAVLTLNSATKIAATLQAAWALAVQGAQLVAGTYNIALIAMKGTTEGLTEAQIASAAAARSTWATLAANPLGAIITVLGLAVSAYLAFKAANEEVTDSISQGEAEAAKESATIEGLVNRALQAAEGTKKRRDAIQTLIQDYPEYFKGLDVEMTSNTDLVRILGNVNRGYEQRIDLARKAYQAEKLAAEQKKLLQEEDDIFSRMTPEMQTKYGGDLQAAFDAFLSGKAGYDKIFADTKAGWFSEGVISQEDVNRITFRLREVSGLMAENAVERQQIEVLSKDAQLKIEEARHVTVMNQLKAAHKSTESEEELHETNIASIKKAGQKKIENGAAEHNEKMKQVTLLSANEIALIKKEGDAEDEQDRIKSLKAQLDFLNKKENDEIDSIKKITVNRKISNAALEALHEDARKKAIAIDAKYDLERAKILEQLEQEEQKAFLTKIQESNDKVAVLTARRLEAEKMLVILNDAKTSEERLAALRVYNDKYTNEVKDAVVKQLKIQLDAADNHLTEVAEKNGEQGDAYRKAYTEWLKANEAYEKALTDQSVNAAKETAQSIQKYEKEIQEAKKETAKIEKDTLEQTKQNRREFLNGIAQLFGQDGSLMGQMATGLMSVYNALDGLNLKALKGAKDNVKSAEDTLSGIKMIYSDGSAEGAAQIANAENFLAKAKGELASAEGLSASSALKLASVAYQVLSTIAGAINERMKEVYLAIAQGLGKAREAYKDFFDFIETASAEAYRSELDSLSGNLKAKEALIREYYATEKEFAIGRDRVDDTLYYYQQIAEIQANAGTNAGDIMRGLIELEADMLKRKTAAIVAQAQREQAEALQLRDAKIQALNDELDAFKDKIAKEIEADNEASAKLIENNKKKLDKDLENLQTAYDKKKTEDDKYLDKLRKNYDDAVEAQRAAQEKDRQQLQETYDLKKQLLDQATADQIEEVSILDRVRDEAVDRYKIAETNRITATRDRILATLTDEGERASVTAEYERQLGVLHDTVEQAKLDKSKGVSLATIQINKEQKDETTRLKEEETAARQKLDDDYQLKFKTMKDEQDKILQKLKDDAEIRDNKYRDDKKVLEEKSAADIKKIETDLKTEINKLKDQILQKEDETTQGKKRLQYEYTQAYLEGQRQIFEANKNLLVAQLQAQIAVLNSQKSWTGIGNGKINDAINTIQDSINQLGGIVFTGQQSVATYLDAYGVNGFGNPKQVITLDGSGSVPAQVFDDKGRELVLSYKEDLSEHTVYRADGSSVKIAQASAKVKGTDEMVFFEGSPYVELGSNPKGRDTIPARINEGERILKTDDNLAIGGRSLTNDQLVEKVMSYDRLMAMYPAFNADLWKGMRDGVQLPTHLINVGNGQGADMSAMLTELRQVKKVVGSLKQVQINMDAGGFYSSVSTHQSKTNYYANLQQR